MKCCVCGNSEPDGFTLFYDKGIYKVMKCNICSFIFVPPVYREKISYTDYKNSAVTEQIRKGNNWIKVQRHNLRIERIKKYKSSGKLFDLGAGWGHFLLAAKLKGYDISGIELSEQPALYAKNDLHLPVERIDFFDMPLTHKYDIITLWDVLEHIDAADILIEKCYSLLNPGGILAIQVPAIDSSISKRFKANWKMISLDHVNYFSKKTLPQLLNKKGFTVEEIKTSIELKLFLMYTVLPFINKVFKKKKQSSAVPSDTTPISSAQRQEFFNKFTKAPKWILRLIVGMHNLSYKTLSALHIGEEMVVIARKIN